MAASRGIGYFSAWDYVVLAAMLVISAAVGFYYARAGQNTTKDFLMGGRSMSAVPVAMSLTASFMSAIAVLGIPSEVYRYGAIYAVCGFTYIIMALISGEIFLPFFYRLGITSTYEYLELRFNRCVRIIGTFIFICLMVLYTGIVIYTPALALNQVTGLNLWGAVVITGGVCTFYCTVGGLKAVVWTDVFQIVIMVAGFAAVIIRSVVVQGGISRIMHDAYEGGRLNFWNFDPSPLKRHTFWTILIGGTIGWTGVYGINQSQVQRYIACRSRCQAKLSLYINLVGLWVIVGSAVLCGLCLYSIYRDCDPWTSKVLTAPDQLLPYLVMDILQNYPGVPGLFIACAYSGTLSTVSSTINALATITVEDFFKPWFQSLSDRKLSWIAKGTSVFYGVLCIAMAAVASLMGGVIQAAGSIFGMVGAPLLGLFSLGMFFPFTNSNGAMAGLISGCTLTIWAGIGSHIYPPPPESQMLLNLSTAGCNISSFEYSNNWTLTTEMPAFTTSVQSVISERPAIADYWYSISYLHLNTIGLFTTLTVGILVSLLTGGRKQQIDKKYLFCKEDFGCDIISCWRTEKKQNTEDLSMAQQPEKKPLEGRENLAFLMPHELCRL